jgi:hypothetical protein
MGVTKEEQTQETSLLLLIVTCVIFFVFQQLGLQEGVMWVLGCTV